MDLMDLVKSQMAGSVVDQLTQNLGGAERDQTAAATEGIINVLMGAMARNAATPDGAAALNRALENDHDGSVLDNLGDILSGNTSQVSDRALNGSGILNHILGNRQGSAIDMISKMSGLDSSKAGNLMATLAPVVMGMLGKAKRQNNLDQGGITDLLGGFAKQQQSQGNPMGSLLSGFLDADGDGSIVDDVAGMLGKGLLGGLFKRR
ncbi:MAG: DUF937 domain-containing protein [Bacteroidetes bacterium]|nr:MAG: DUF937 domain-containing protein [Bacteroidota bacterium]